MAEVYMTVQGRSKDTTNAIVESRAHLGVESSKDWLDGVAPRFIDFPFTNPNSTFSDHLDVVKSVRPKLAVAPDIEGNRSLSSVVNIADRLLQYSQNIIIVPKTVHPSTIPDRFRVGVPLADFGSSAPWSVWDYRECGPVHLLGGGPTRQLRVGKHLRVASVDTATLGKTCRFGMWDGKSIDAPDEWDYRRRLKASLTNYANVWADSPEL